MIFKLTPESRTITDKEFDRLFELSYNGPYVMNKHRGHKHAY